MTDPSTKIAVIAGLCAGLPPIIVSVINRIHVSRRVEAVHVQINSRMDEWIEAAKALSRAEGVAEGTADEKARDKTKDSPNPS